MLRPIFALATMAIIAAATPAAAQEAAIITGRVTNAQTGQPEPAVTIHIEGSTIRTATDMGGRYRLTIPAERLRTGQLMSIMAMRVGMAASRRSFSLAPGTTVTHNFQLAPDVVAIEDVVVD